MTNCHGLKMKAADGKMRLTDVADQEQMFRLIQSIPSPKAEPIKQWIARVASERIDEIQDPEKAIDRGIEYYRQKGYSEKWIEERMKGKDARNELEKSLGRSVVSSANAKMLMQREEQPLIDEQSQKSKEKNP